MWTYNYTSELYHHGIKGQKWGVRRYQNADGSLTAKGQARYERDLADNPLTKEERRLGGRQANPNKWVKEDLGNAKRITDSGVNFTNQVSTALNQKSHRKPMDLSKMTDKEMRDQINRKLLERQYNDLFNESSRSRGREVASDIVKGVGTTLGITGSALSIALAIKNLKG